MQVECSSYEHRMNNLLYFRNTLLSNKNTPYSKFPNLVNMQSKLSQINKGTYIYARMYLAYKWALFHRLEWLECVSLWWGV